MNMSEWADVLAKIADDSERRDCLLILADSMRSELGAQVLRELANRDQKLFPEVLGDDPPWRERFDWNQLWEDNSDDKLPETRLPKKVIDRMKKTTHPSRDHYPVHYRPYGSKYDAWLALLETLDAYEETNDEQ